MKAFALMAAVSAALLFFLVNASPALARNGWGLEDPQLCVNGELLTVIPATPEQVFVQVPKNAVVDFEVSNCGGNPDLGIVLPNQVSVLRSNLMKVTARVPDGTLVAFDWDNVAVNVVAKGGAATAVFATK